MVRPYRSGGLEERQGKQMGPLPLVVQLVHLKKGLRMEWGGGERGRGQVELESSLLLTKTVLVQGCNCPGKEYLF